MDSKLQLILLISFFAFCVMAAGESALKAPLKYFIFREDCYNKFFNEHDFMHQECVKFTISKLIGTAIICGAGILKVPQIVKILKAGSADGLSKTMYYLEVSLSAPKI